jgi:hypothetical protein
MALIDFRSARERTPVRGPPRPVHSETLAPLGVGCLVLQSLLEIHRVALLIVTCVDVTNFFP